MLGGGDKHHLPTLDEAEMSPGGTNGHAHQLRRPTSGSTDSRSLPSPSATQHQHQQQQMADWSTMDKKKRKQAEEMHQLAERQRRALMEQNQREQSRAVIEKRKAIQQQQRAEQHELEWKWQHTGSLLKPQGEHPALGQEQQKQKQQQAPAPPPQQQQQQGRDRTGTLRAPVRTEAARQPQQQQQQSNDYHWVHEQRYAKARRREFDDDHSMSSSDVHSIGPLSSISFASVDTGAGSDPGPGTSLRLRGLSIGSFGGSSFGGGGSLGIHNGITGGVGRMASSSSLRTSFDDYAPSSSTHSQSLEQQFANGFTMMDDGSAVIGGGAGGAGQQHRQGYAHSHTSSRIEGSVSPPPMQMLSLGNVAAATQSNGTGFSSHRAAHPTYISIPPVSGSLVLPEQHRGSYDYSSSGYGPSPSLKSAINPIFKVVRVLFN
jgi:hypothetical protein